MNFSLSLYHIVCITSEYDSLSNDGHSVAAHFAVWHVQAQQLYDCDLQDEPQAYYVRLVHI